jgi:dihydroxy-acid dehydratase
VSSEPTHRRGKWQSGAITEGPSHAGARSMLRAAGFDRDALARPIVGVANTWTEIGPCNLHLRDLAAPLKNAIRDAGGTPMEFNTVSISDGIVGDARVTVQPPSAV